MKSPAFRFYPSDFWASPDVQVMDLHEVGAYVSLLSAAWLSDRPGCLEDDDQKLRRWARMNPEQWAESRGTLLCKFPILEPGFRSNPRLYREAEKQQAFSTSQSEKGKKGGRPKAGDKPGLSNGKPGLIQSESPEKPSVSVSVSEEQEQEHAPSALKLDGKTEQAEKRYQLSDADVLSIWNLWPNRNAQKQALESIRKALRQRAGAGVDDPVADLAARVRTWLAWHARVKASGEFIAEIGYAQGWFGDKQRRYLDPNAEPRPEPMLLVDGKLITLAESEAAGWTTMRGDG